MGEKYYNSTTQCDRFTSISWPEIAQAVKFLLFNNYYNDQL